MAYSGIFRPTNPNKYVGDHKNIIWRSTWECRVMTWLDKNPNIVSWASEEVIVPYISPVDGKWHRYFPDFLVKIKDKQGSSAQAGGSQMKSREPLKETSDMRRQTEKVEKSQGGNEALAGLGIEFGPSQSSRKAPVTPEKSQSPSGQGSSTGPGPKTFSLNEIMQKGENVPFNKNRKDKKERKSVDVEDLKKALSQALDSSSSSSSEDENK